MSPGPFPTSRCRYNFPSSATFASFSLGGLTFVDLIFSSPAISNSSSSGGSSAEVLTTFSDSSTLVR
ncbi:uncharacterized protein METZ01_LOCUS194962 [marine metagenome]|uniref:Uncharacterized protein n=1 Tax=marine metagenome TaxID=408172 RepID=A0A382DUP7_9ZZZZ